MILDFRFWIGELRQQAEFFGVESHRVAGNVCEQEKRHERKTVKRGSGLFV
jgi:hypothetical protein